MPAPEPPAPAGDPRFPFHRRTSKVDSAREAVPEVALAGTKSHGGVQRPRKVRRENWPWLGAGGDREMRVFSRRSFGVLRGGLVVSREEFMVDEEEVVVEGEEVEIDGVESEEREQDLELLSVHAHSLSLDFVFPLSLR